MNTARYNLPCQVVFGAGTLPETVGIARTAGHRVLVLTGSNSAQERGFVDQLLRGLSSAGLEYTVRGGLQGCATADSLLPVARFVGDYSPDAVIALGGGAAINAAKAAAALSRSACGAEMRLGGEFPEPADIPVIAVPTLPPNGAELGSSVLIYGAASPAPVLWRHERLAPRYAVVDYNLVLSAPPTLVGLSALDGLVHAVEAYTSTRANEISDALAIDAARRLGLKLVVMPAALDDTSVQGICAATLLAGMAWETAGLGAAHALALTMAQATNKPHGLVSAALLPLVMRFNMPKAHEKYAALAHAWGVAAGGDTVDQAAQAIRHVMNLNRHAGVPMHLRSLDIPEEPWDQLVQSSAASDFMADNPRETQAAPLKAILSEGW